ncbi:hypothetical protein PMAYCL1PPCAC_19225, partial [Pristionchus mayeri]
LFILIAASYAETCIDKLKWTTSGGRIMVNDQPLVLKGVNYFGFETETFAPHGIWDHDLNDFLDFIKNNGFNAIRVPFSMELVKNSPKKIMAVHCHNNPGLCQKSAYHMLDTFINRAAERGLLVMLSNHRNAAGGYISPPLWYDNAYTEVEVIKLWKILTDRYADRWNVFAIDLKNEPHDNATWGDSKPQTDWNKAAERMIMGLSSFQGLFFVGGIEWGGRFEKAAQYPINTGLDDLNNRVVYSPHAYGPDVYDRPEFNVESFPNNLDEIYRRKFGFLVENGHPVVIGEWGGKAVKDTRDETWNKWFVEWMRRKCLTNNFYWCLNPNSDHTGGLLEEDWKTPVQHKINLVNRAQPHPTKFKTHDGKICITKGSFPEGNCQR